MHIERESTKNNDASTFHTVKAAYTRIRKVRCETNSTAVIFVYSFPIARST